MTGDFIDCSVAIHLCSGVNIKVINIIKGGKAVNVTEGLKKPYMPSTLRAINYRTGEVDESAFFYD